MGPGDSGSPIIDADGKATGVVTHAQSYDWPHIHMQYGSRLVAALDRANAVTGMGFGVVDADLGFDPTGLLVPE